MDEKTRHIVESFQTTGSPKAKTVSLVAEELEKKTPRKLKLPKKVLKIIAERKLEKTAETNEYKRSVPKLLAVGAAGAISNVIPGPVQAPVAAALAPKGKKKSAATAATVDAGFGAIPGYATGAYLAQSDIRKWMNRQKSVKHAIKNINLKGLSKYKLPLALTMAGSALGAARGYDRIMKKTSEYDPTKTKQAEGWDDEHLQGRKRLSATSKQKTPNAIRQIADEWLMRKPPAGVRKFGNTGRIFKYGMLSKILWHTQ